MASVVIEQQRRGSQAVRWLPLVLLPSLVLSIGNALPAWGFMWLLGFAIFFGLKWLTFIDCQQKTNASWARQLGYLLAWPGMDADAFFCTKSINRPLLMEWMIALNVTTLGLSFIYAATLINASQVLLIGWVGMVGVVLTLHFGLFHLLALAWQQAGVDAVPIMNAPILASSLSEFWGKRWNLGFRDLAHRYVFRPSQSLLGIANATLLIFLISGLVHDLVVSVPAASGYGLPTLYFLIQGFGLLLERTAFIRDLGKKYTLFGRVYCAAFTLAPVGLLFHRGFVENVIAPMILFIVQLGS